MVYLKLVYKYMDHDNARWEGLQIVGVVEREVEIELTPEVIRDFKDQLAPQIKARNLTIAELQEVINAIGISPKNVINFLMKK